MIRATQLIERFMPTTQNDSIPCADLAGSGMGSVVVDINITDADNFAWDSFFSREFLGGRKLTGLVLHTFYRAYRRRSLGSNYINLANQSVSRLAKHSAWECSIRQSLEPKTIHRSREHRPMVVFSI